jgi:catechol 2,3-dioxygenase-like lactoylglutathione lyase family enzyme
METATTSGGNDGSDELSPLPSTHRLSHVMLKVPSVDRTVAYWTERLGSVIMSRENEQGSLQSAFVALGNGTSTDNCFAPGTRDDC